MGEIRSRACKGAINNNVFVKYMKRNRLFLFIYFLSLVCFSRAYSDSYPAWFLFPPQNCITAVGFDWDNRGAFVNGIEKYHAYVKSTVKGTIRFADNDGLALPVRDNVIFTFTSDSLKENKLFCHDTIYLDSRMAIAIGDSFCGCSRKSFDLDTIERPDWIIKPSFKDGAYLFCVGRAPYSAYGRMISWITAERNAINEISVSASCRFKNLVRYSGKKSIALTEIEVNVTIQDIRVVQRWSSEEDKTCWVLVKGIPSFK